MPQENRSKCTTKRPKIIVPGARGGICYAHLRAHQAQWVNKAKKTSQTAQTIEPRFVSYKPCGKLAVPDGSEPTESGTDSVKTPNTLVSPSDDELTQCCRELLHHGFEAVLGLFLGRYGCPFVRIDAIMDANISATKLFAKLDEMMGERTSCQNPALAATTAKCRQQRETQIEQSLTCTTRAFAAQWLPLMPQYSRLPIAQVQEISRDCWRAARRDMLRVINHVSYRSILVLYLFAQTPIPAGISEEEELDGMSGQVCMQTALYQLQRLRERRAACLSDWSASSNPDTSTDITPQFVDLESRVYWAAMMWDTSSSLTSGTRTSLSSGLKGACAEPTWRIVKAFLIGSFESRSQRWRDENFQVIDDNAYEIISAASICKTFIWKTITSLKEALREGVQDDGVMYAWTALVDGIEIFSTSVRPLLNACERKLLFLDQRVRLSWYSLQLQYYLGILLLADVLEVAQREDLLPKIEKAERDAEHEALIVLKFGLENRCTIHCPEMQGSGNVEQSRLLINASLVAIDPYPQYVLDLVLLMHKRLGRRLCTKSITRETHSRLLSILLEAVQELSQSSKAVQAAGIFLNKATRGLGNQTTPIETS